MKTKILIFLCLFLSVISCNIENKKLEIPQNEQLRLFSEAKNLKGLEIFIIGKTTIKTIDSINKLLRKEAIQNADYDTKETYNYIGWNNFDSYGKFEYKEGHDDYINSILEKEKEKHCPFKKTYEWSGISERYKIGTIELYNLTLYFYKDTLYKIECEEWSDDLLFKAFIQKYGKGKLLDSTRSEISQKGKNAFGVELTETTTKQTYEKVWENEKVKAIYKHNYTLISNTMGKSGGHVYEGFTIQTKDTTIENTIFRYFDKIYKEEENKKKIKEQESVNKI